MQNTSPGPEGKKREGKTGKGRQRTEYECRHFCAGLLSTRLQPWRREDEPHRAPSAGRQEPGHSQHCTNQGEPEGQHPGGRAVYTAGWWKAALCTPLLGKLLEGGLTLEPQWLGLPPCTQAFSSHGMPCWQFLLPTISNSRIKNNISVRFG